MYYNERRRYMLIKAGVVVYNNGGSSNNNKQDRCRLVFVFSSGRQEMDERPIKHHKIIYKKMKNIYTNMQPPSSSQVSRGEE
jgi:hypothetical protein